VTGSPVVRAPEPSGFLPGTYGSMFIFNFTYPEGLFTGDLLWTLSGSVQEFTSTTQLTFPAWTIRERVQLRPYAEWDIHLRGIQPTLLQQRICGSDNKVPPFITDILCGHNRRNLKMESLESSLVKVKSVRFPQRFVDCDQNGNNSVPFFCEGTNPTTSVSAWGSCDIEGTAPDPEAAERACNIDCVTSQGPHAGVLCSEKTTYDAFGQFLIELPASGPPEAGLDDSLPTRMQELPVSGTSNRNGVAYGEGRDVVVWCNTNVRLRFGDATVTATGTDPALASGTLLPHRFVGTETHVAFVSDGTAAPGARCVIGEDAHTRLNVITRDAAPDLKPNCDPDDADAAAAQNCRNLRGATFDIVGHLRHLQPGRPRWALLPRDSDDLCCHPGPGLSCPTSIKACP
jgi:hypothetical protein